MDAQESEEYESGFVEMEEEEDAEEISSFPIVMYCSKCSIILGDTTAWVAEIDDLKSVSLKSKMFFFVTHRKPDTSKFSIILG